MNSKERAQERERTVFLEIEATAGSEGGGHEAGEGTDHFATTTGM